MIGYTRVLKLTAAVIAVGAMLPSRPVGAVTPPPAIPQLPGTRTVLPTKPSTGLRLGHVHVVLEQTTLAEVQKAVAAGVISAQGDAGAGMSWLCYTSQWPPTPERLWVATHNEMGGPEQRVMAVTVQRLSTAAATSDCPALPRALTPVRIDNGPSLNDRAGAMADVLHVAVIPGKEWYQFNYSGKVHGSGGCRPEGFDLLNGLSVQLIAGRVALLQITQVTSC